MNHLRDMGLQALKMKLAIVILLVLFLLNITIFTLTLFGHKDNQDYWEGESNVRVVTFLLSLVSGLALAGSLAWYLLP